MNLSEAVNVIRSCEGNPHALANHPEVLVYLEDTSNVGADILKQLPDDELSGACALMLSLAVADLLGDGENGAGLFLLSQPEVFVPLMATLLRASVGITAQENWMMLRDR